MEIEKHPRFNELCDVFPQIWEYTRTFYKPWEKKFQKYLNFLDNGNLMIWLHYIYGDMDKFPVKKRFLKKRKSYNLLNNNAFPIKIAVCLMPFMCYFNFDLEFSPSEDYIEKSRERFNVVLHSNAFTELKLFFEDYTNVQKYSAFIFHNGLFFFDFFKQFMKNKFKNLLKIEVRLKNFPLERRNPDFRLEFNTHKYFYSALE